jgi:TolB-like protein/class 3 adenylate cyclase/tetratricopeptide (TPR) repeat protein
MASTRRLAAILAADVVGYSRLMGEDEEGTHERLKAHLQGLVEPKIREHRGRIVKNTGDGFLAEFQSVVDAIRCATEVQRGMGERNADAPPEERIEFRIGINLGDVIVEEHDIFGDGVNVAARLEALAEPGGVLISSTVYDHIRDRLPFGFEDLGDQEVKNIARPVRVYRVWDNTATSPPSPTLTLLSQAPPLPDKPSIAVLPFANMSGDPEQEYFADGMVEEIITALSRTRWLFVIARNSSFTYKGQPTDVRQVGRELGVRYVLEGSVRKVGDRIRITVQLIDATSGAHIWADRFDGSLENVFDFQDEVAVSVAGVIEPRVEAAEIQRSSVRPTTSLTAYDYYLRALPSTSAFEKNAAKRALDLLSRAIEHDPRYGRALALAAFWRLQLHTNDWTEDETLNRDEAIELARRALQVADDDPVALADAAGVLASFGGDHDTCIRLIDRSLELNPSCVIAWHWSAWLKLSAGLPDLATEHFEKSLRLDPRGQGLRPIYLTGLGIAHFMRRQFAEACPLLLASLQQLPSHVTTYRFLAACYAHLGRLCEAREIIERLRAISPAVVPSAANYRNPEHRELFLSGLRLAAGEAT